MSRNSRKRTFGHVRPANIQISLRIRRIFTGRIWDNQGCKVSSFGQLRLIRLCGCAGWSESSLGAHIRRYVFLRFGLYDCSRFPLPGGMGGVGILFSVRIPLTRVLLNPDIPFLGKQCRSKSGSGSAPFVIQYVNLCQVRRLECVDWNAYPHSQMLRNARKLPSDMCAQRRFRSACTFAQPGQNLHWANMG